MTTLTADSGGRLSGKFMIPANIAVGTKGVTALGSIGSYGGARYTGRGVITTEERRIVNTVVTEQLVINPGVNPASGVSRVDPLAQTFTLTEGRHIVGLDLWFTAKGTRDCLIQIRRTSNGFPTQDILCEKRQAAADIVVTGGNPTAITFNAPQWLEPGVEYALVILSDDALTAVSIAELGKYDSTAGKYITSQPFQVGVLLSSSNASTWTAHQDRDLTFRLKAAKFTSTTRAVALGTVAVTNLSDMLALFNVDIPATGASAELTATSPTGEVFRMGAGEPLSLPARITGNMTLSLNLTGTDKASPVLYPGIQFAAGNLGETATYITRSFPVGTSGRISVTFEGITPGTSAFTVEYQKPDTSWQAITLTSGTDVGDGWVERSYIVTGVTQTSTRIRITATGTTAQRPRGRKLRAIATA